MVLSLKEKLLAVLTFHRWRLSSGVLKLMFPLVFQRPLMFISLETRMPVLDSVRIMFDVELVVSVKLQLVTRLRWLFSPYRL